MNFFEDYLNRKEETEINVEMGEYIQAVLSHVPTHKESEESLLMQIEDSSDNLAALIAAASKIPQKLNLVPSGPAAGKLRVIVNGGESPLTWNPHGVIKQTAMNMGRLGRLVQMAKDSVPNWGGSKIVIMPSLDAFPASDGIVQLNRCGCGKSFKAGIHNKGLKLVGPEDDDDSDLAGLIDKLKSGFESKPKLVRLVFHAPKSMRGKLKKAGREIAVLRKAFIPAVPMKKPKKDSKKKDEGLDLWRVRVDERFVGLPINETYWPIENEPLEILSLELIESEPQKEERHEDQHN
jgi:hypothetical protein